MNALPLPRAVTLALALALALLASTAAGCDTGETSVLAPSACSDAAAVTREELESGAPPMCEHQTLVASLQPKDDFVLPLALVRDTIVEYCFEDDDGEGHRASIVSGDHTVLSLTAGEGCVPARLSPGQYGLRLRHQFLDDRTDLTPDVVHTRLEARGDGTHRLLLTTNACPGCDLRGKAWPLLGIYILEGPAASGQASLTFNFGWEGDYTGAHFEGSVCQGNAQVTRLFSCSLGAVGIRTAPGGQGGVDTTKSSFDGATFDGTTVRGAQALYIGRDACLQGRCNPPSATTFVGASFRNLVTSLGGPLGTFAFIGGDLTGADWENTAITAQHCAIHKAVLGGREGLVYQPRITVTAGTYGGNQGAGHGNVTSHLAATCNGQPTCTYNVDSRVIGDPEPNLKKDYVAEWTCPGDSVPRRTTLGAEASGQSVTLNCSSSALPTLGPTCEVRDSDIASSVFLQLARSGTTAFGNTVHVTRGADLSNQKLDGTTNTFVWPTDATNKLDLPGANFAGATLSHVTFPCVGDGGNLSGAHFKGATLANVAFSGCNLGGADFTGATLHTVVMKKASLLNAQLVDVIIDDLDLQDSSVTGLSLQLRPGGKATSLSAIGIVGGLLAPKLSAPGADFTGARFDHADFSGALLGVIGDKGVHFDGATLDYTSFDNAHLEGASFIGATGTGALFSGAYLTGKANLEQVKLTSSTLDGADLTGANFKLATVCGGSAMGLLLPGANLTGTLFPSESNIYTLGGTKISCGGVRTSDGVTTDAATTCPDASMSPSGCATEASWTPAGAVAMCCTTGTMGCTRPNIRKGFPCSTPCDCASLACNAGICG